MTSAFLTLAAMFGTVIIVGLASVKVFDAIDRRNRPWKEHQ